MAVAARRTVDTERVIPPVPVRRFSVEEYHRLIEAGVFRSGDPFELLDGWIVPKTTIHPAHNSAVRRLARRLNRLLGDEWVIQVQSPIILRDRSEPEPDVVVARGPEECYDAVNPAAADVALVVEVSDTSLAEDRGTRLAIYARARLTVYWVVNLVDRRVETYTLPRGGKVPAYRRRDEYGLGAALPVVLGGEQAGAVPVRDILPRAL